MIDVIFKAIKKRVAEQLPCINHVAMYEQNDVLQQGSLPFLPPVLFISFENMNQEILGSKVQRTKLLITIRFVFEEYHENYLKGLKMKRDVAYHLNYWSDGTWGGTGLQQITNIADERADELYVYVLKFTCSYMEDYNNSTILIGGETLIDYDITLTLDQIDKNGTNGFASGTNGVVLKHNLI